MDCKDCGKPGFGPLCPDCNDKRLEKRVKEIVADSIPSGPPSGIIVVKGGALSKECIERLKDFMDDAKVNPDLSKILIMEAESFGKDTTIRWIPTNGIDSPPIIQLHKDGVTGTVISGSIEEVREILRKDGSLLPGLEIDET